MAAYLFTVPDDETCWAALMHPQCLHMRRDPRLMIVNFAIVYFAIVMACGWRPKICATEVSLYNTLLPSYRTDSVKEWRLRVSIIF